MAFHADQMRLPQTARTARRERLFRERPLDTLERWALGVAWSLTPKRIGGMPALARLYLSDLLAPDYALPDPARALNRPLGLAGIVHDLSLPTLLSAYRRGLYPLAHIAPLKWWSPPTRSVLFFDEAHIARRLRRQMRRGQYTVTFDRDFDGVIAACAGRRPGRRFHLNWITPPVMKAYAAAYDAGHAHSFEVWNERGQLAGGGYGLAVGSSFVTESQFSAEPNTSKIGFTVLNWHLARWGFAFNDGKVMTPTTKAMGFREIPRADFLMRLHRAGGLAVHNGRWQAEAGPAVVADWQPGAA